MASTAGIGLRSACTFTRPSLVGRDGRHCRHLRCSPAGPAARCLSNARLDGRCGGYGAGGIHPLGRDGRSGGAGSCRLPAPGCHPFVPRSLEVGAHATRDLCRSLARSEEQTSELPSLMSISYAGFCLKKKKKYKTTHRHIVCTENTDYYLQVTI